MSSNPACPESKGLPEGQKDSDDRLKAEALKIPEERKRLGLEGLVGGLQAVVINTEPEMQRSAIEELLRYTGLRFQEAFQDTSLRTCVLKVPGAPNFRSADFLITCRLKGRNPFEKINIAPKSKQLPSTRLETFIFETNDIDRYVSIQRSQGVKFLTDNIVDEENYSFIQTEPSRFTGNSIGLIQWKGGRGDYKSADSKVIDWNPEKPDLDYLKNIRWIDHAATRVKAQERDAAIIEFMKLTNYKFDFAIYVKGLNSITSVARLSHSDYAAVFTSGITPYISDEISGPTEKFIQNYGIRVHHIAFQTEKIEETFQAIKDDGMKFLIELVGSPEEGLKQTFTEPSKNTLLVNEYIHRYGDFDGFFTKSNVTLLTAATGKQ
ncbi:MAG: hypothetical protein ACE14P_01535 [Methanotrichaceae archaeon]